MLLLITGGAGFIGKWIIRQLPGNIEIVVVDSLDKQIHSENNQFPDELLQRAECIKADVRQIERYGHAIEKCDIILHLAAQTGTGQSMYQIGRYVQHNVDGLACLLDALSSRKDGLPEKIILASSRAIYGEGAYGNISFPTYPLGRKSTNMKKGIWEIQIDGNSETTALAMQENHEPHPVSTYGWTKLWQEQLLQHYAKLHGVQYFILRIQNAYGSGQSLSNPYTGIIGIFAAALFTKTGAALI